MSTNDNTGESGQSRRGFLRAAATGTAAVGVAAGATGTAAAQDDGQNETTQAGNESDAGGAGGHGGEGGEHSEGKIVFTPELQAIGVALVLGVLSPIVFALMLAFNRDKLDGAEQTGRADNDLKRIE